jgi:hypothetical protein
MTLAFLASQASAQGGAYSFGATAAPPHVLSVSDVRLYREILTDESEGRFAHARSLIGELSDRSLIGYVEAEHFLSPYLKHPAVLNLAEWLREYPDLPVASRIHALTEERNRHLRRRRRIEVPGVAGIPWRPLGGSYEETDRIANPPLATDAALAAQAQIDSYVKLDQPAAAEIVLDQTAAMNVAPSTDIARLTQRVAAAYLSQGQDDAAFRVASSIAGPERAVAPLLDWDAGLAAYRECGRRTRLDAECRRVLGSAIASRRGRILARNISSQCCRARATDVLRHPRTAYAGWRDTRGVQRPFARFGQLRRDDAHSCRAPRHCTLGDRPHGIHRAGNGARLCRH